jgi:hypothetical protein
VPVAVHIPIRLRLPLRALKEGAEDAHQHGGDWEAALTRAFDRAWLRSLDTVMGQRGGYAHLQTHPVTFRWSGEGTSQVTAGMRSRWEERIAELMVGLIEDRKDLGSLAAAGSGQEPMADLPVERADEERMSAMAHLYVMPSYGGPEGDAESIVFEADEGDVIVASPKGLVESADWIVFKNSGQAIAAYASQLNAPPGPEYLGILFKVVGHKGYGLSILHFVGDVFQVVMIGVIDDLVSSPTWDSKRRAFVSEKIALPPQGEYAIAAVHRDVTAAEKRKQAVTDVLGPGLRGNIELHWTPPKGMKSADQPAAREKIYQEQIDKLVVATERAEAFVVLSLPSGPALCNASATLAANFPPTPIRVIPLSRTIMVKAQSGGSKGKGGDGESAGGGGEGKGSGKGAGKGKGGEGDGLGGGGDESAKGDGGDGGQGKGGEGGAGKGGSGLGFEDGSEDAKKSIVSFPPSFGFGTFVCEPFEDELPVDELGSHATHIKRLLAQIAFRLRIPICRFPGNFCIHAARVIGSRARDVANFALDDCGATTVAEPGTGDVGGVNFTPKDSPAVQFLRHLAGTLPYITRLERAIAEAYWDSSNSSRLGGMYQNNPASWLLHFYEESTPSAKGSVGWIFLYGCQVLMLQLLRASKEAIEARLDPAVFPKYAEFFEQIVFCLLADQAELMELRETLNSYLAENLSSTADVATEVVNKWRRAHRVGTQAGLVEEGLEAGRVVDVSGAASQWFDAQSSLLATMAGAIEGMTADGEGAGGGWRGQIVETKAGAAIRDGKGRLWTKKELDNAIALGQGVAESVDPLVKQLLDLPGVMPLFKQNPWLVKVHLKHLLEQMLTNNREITAKVTGSAPFAFEHGRIQEDEKQQSTIPGTLYQLQGIHRVVHEHIGSAFMGDGYYALGINSLFGAQQGFESLTGGFVFIGLILLAVVCPPAAFWAGVALSLHELDKAEETKQIYGSLLDPEELVSRMEMEIGLFMAELGVVLSFIPEAGNIIKKVTSAGETIAKQGLRQGLKTVGRGAVREVMEEVAKQLKKNLAAALVREIAVFTVFDKVMSVMVEPLISAMEAQLGGPDLSALPGLVESGAASDTIDWDSMPVSEDDSGQGDAG